MAAPTACVGVAKGLSMAHLANPVMRGTTIAIGIGRRKHYRFDTAVRCVDFASYEIFIRTVSTFVIVTDCTIVHVVNFSMKDAP